MPLFKKLVDGKKMFFFRYDLVVEYTTDKILSLERKKGSEGKKPFGSNHYYLYDCGNLLVGLFLSCRGCECEDSFETFQNLTANYICPKYGAP